MARTMLCESNLPRYFWAEAINTACYISNHILIHLIKKKTSYELWKNRKSNIKYFKVFGSRCFVLNNDKENLEKFDAKSDEGIFLLGNVSQSQLSNVDFCNASVVNVHDLFLLIKVIWFFHHMCLHPFNELSVI